MNWNISNIWDIRDRWIVTRGGEDKLVKLYASGWVIGEYERLDIYSACALLNETGAEVKGQVNYC